MSKRKYTILWLCICVIVWTAIVGIVITVMTRNALGRELTRAEKSRCAICKAAGAVAFAVKPKQPTQVLPFEWSKGFDLDKRAAKEQKPAALFFSGRTCQPCKELELRMRDMRIQKLLQRCVCGKVEIEDMTADERKRYGIRYVPRLVVVRHDWQAMWVVKTDNGLHDSLAAAIEAADENTDRK